MNRKLAALSFLLVGALAFGQVDKDELAKGQGTSITFTNYVGPHNRHRHGGADRGHRPGPRPRRERRAR